MNAHNEAAIIEPATNRIAWIDLARALAISFVLIVHAVEGIYALNLDAVAHLSTQTTVFAFSAFTLGRIGVPLFLFISGYLLLDRDYTREGCIRFWKKRWLPLLLCTWAWLILYHLFLAAMGKQPLSLEYFIRTVLFVDKFNMAHFWYMPVILGVYLFIPVIAIALKKLDARTIAFPLAIVAVFAFVTPVVNQILVATGGDPLSVRFDLGYSGGVYGIYLLLGWCVKTAAGGGIFGAIPTKVLAVAAIVLFVLCVSFQLWSYSLNSAYNIWYTNGLLVLCALACFELLSRIPDNRVPAYKVVYTVSYYSFALYLVHFPIRMLIAPAIKALPVMLPIQTLVLWALTFTISLIVSWAISKIPRIGKPLLYLKER